MRPSVKDPLLVCVTFQKNASLSLLLLLFFWWDICSQFRKLIKDMDATKLSRYIYTLGMNYKNSLRKDSAGVKFTLFLFLFYFM